MRRPKRVIAQVMTLGTFDDVRRLMSTVDEDALRDVLASAEAGWFDERSWHYWHYKLSVAELGKVPPLPKREFS